MWKIIPNTNNNYLAHPNGDIKRADGVVNFGSQIRPVGGKILSPKTKSNGYKEVNLMIERNKGVSKYVHRIIATTFLGEIPKGFNINHKDGNKSNNNLDNLEIVSFSENIKHAYRNGLIKSNPPKGSEHPNSKTNEKEVTKIRKEHSKHHSIKKLQTDYPHLSKGILAKVVYRESWKHI